MGGATRIWQRALFCSLTSAAIAVSGRRARIVPPARVPTMLAHVGNANVPLAQSGAFRTQHPLVQSSAVGRAQSVPSAALQKDLPWRSRTGRFSLPPSAESRAFELPRPRRLAVLAAAVAGLGVHGQPAKASEPTPVTEKELQRLAAGHKEMEYLMANWNKVTRDCSVLRNGNMKGVLESGVRSPDACIPTPDIVRKYMGDRSLYDNLFNTQQLWKNIMISDVLPSKEEDRFTDAIEDFELHRRQASEWAYTSSWGEANPGGGRDKVEDYLLRSKAEAQLALKSLTTIVVDVLKLRSA